MYAGGGVFVAEVSILELSVRSLELVVTSRPINVLGLRVAGEVDVNGLLLPVLNPAGLELVFARDEDWSVRGFELFLWSLFFRLLNMLDLELGYEG